jgi:hypothetical protein
LISRFFSSVNIWANFGLRTPLNRRSELHMESQPLEAELACLLDSSMEWVALKGALWNQDWYPRKKRIGSPCNP